MKKIFLTGLLTFCVVANAKIVVFIDQKYNDYTISGYFKIGTEYGEWSEWINDVVGNYDCDEFTPDVDTQDYGVEFTQTRNCLVDQERTRIVYNLYNDGTKLQDYIENEEQTITTTESQIAIGTDGFPQNQIAKFKADNPTNYTRFGGAVSIDGDMAVVGHIGDKDNGDYAGAAYILKYDGSNWNKVQKIKPSDGSASSSFGSSVAIQGNTIVVGADKENSAGAAYIFTYNGSTWSQQAKLKSSDIETNDVFGISVGISDNKVIVGAYGEDSTVAYSNVGAAYVFAYNGTNWNQEAKLLANDGTDSDWFGEKVDIEGNTAIISARGDKDNGSSSGAAYVFKYDGTNWIQQDKITPIGAESGDYFGAEVAIKDSTILVGARSANTASSNGGAVYIFSYNGSNWAQDFELTASDSESSDYFGSAIAMEGNTILVGAYREDEAGDKAGAVYVYRKSNGNWNEEMKIMASDAIIFSDFGFDVSISNNIALIGSSGNESGTGSVYLFGP